ncbi:hypothetical protein [Caproiciproducens galactitolivorans]|uniref:Uncharacterized protein n=1 Tax=Caproiciproducens galactitolivorans TaxID=642589 RepID=A0ABT4BSK9_9FIRM|nr:hypothetical protein [Caproiciproducens galactitolivorans]MCY1713882.1 hypothetical protein [Caproiciproducens galactitolivorans]
MGKKKAFALTLGASALTVLLGLWIKALRNHADTVPYRVIGGADGPTAIFVSGGFSNPLFYAAGAVLVLLCAAVIFFDSRHKI